MKLKSWKVLHYIAKFQANIFQTQTYNFIILKEQNVLWENKYKEKNLISCV